jgi:hypothetical protein
MNVPTQDKWLDVLQGRAEPTDRETREARAIREYILERLEVELTPLSDPEREKRLRNRVEAQFPALAAPAPEPKESLLKSWFGSWQMGWPTLGAVAAAVVLGVLVVPLMQNQSSPHDDFLTPKVFTPDSAAPATDQVSPEALARAQAFSEQVRQALAPLGVSIQVKPTPTGLEISADIEPEQRAAAAQALTPLGVKMPEDGRLRVLVR